MNKVGIVILNYLNYKDTIECVESIFNMKYDIAGIVIVDNHSENESYNVLKKLYKNRLNVSVIQSNRNYGFAKGNNIGIKVVRQKYKAEFVFAVNNDVIFVKEDYFKILMDKYHTNVGIIGSEIHIKGNNIQNIYSVYIGLKENIVMLQSDYLEYKKFARLEQMFPNIKLKNRKAVLHGCALLFTPDFFKYYHGFYDRTFLYNEETILYLMCQKYGLQQAYVADTYLYHKEDQSSKMSFQNSNSIMSKYCFQSRKYVIWWIIKNKLNRFIK